MAIYHYHAGFVSRSTGRSAVQCAAYITGSQLEESRRDITADYRNRSSDIIFSATLAPEHAPSHMKTLEVWNTLETYEDHYANLHYLTAATQEKYKASAQLAQTVVVALPKELTPEVWKELVVDFTKERFVERGLVVTMAIHNDEGNPHAHLMISRRSVTENGEWSVRKDREIVTKTALVESRKLWAEKVNHYLQREGLEARIDHRSNTDMGILFEPSRHEGWYAHKLEIHGIRSRIIEENQEIKAHNKENLGLKPEVILKELTTKHATFSTLDLSRNIQKRIGDDPKLAAYIYEASLNQAILVGTSLDGQARYTSQSYLELEQQAFSGIQDLMGRTSKLSIDQKYVEQSLNNNYSYTNDEQRQAIAKCSSNDLCQVLIGRAGSGKTTTMKAVVELHQQAGFEVVGLTLAATAADTLGKDANCSAETIAFYTDKWRALEISRQEFWSLHPSSEHARIVKRLRALEGYELTDKHLVIVDEAGMVGTAQWKEILEQVQKAGAKLIAVGDNHQFKAIDAGDFFRKFKEEAQAKNHVSELSQILRQKQDWMKQATQNLAELKTYQALSDYEQKGHLIKTESLDVSEIASAYLKHRHEKPEHSQLLLAYTRAECQKLNDEVRILLKNEGKISSEEITINNRHFAVGDEIVFLANDRCKNIRCFDPENNSTNDFLVRNGTRAKISHIAKIEPLRKPYLSKEDPVYRLFVDIDKQTSATFLTNKYSDIDHSYALTLHKAQGQTVDWSMVVASPYMDAHATYVALTRHRQEVTVFYDTKTFGDFKGLQRSLSRISNKDLSIDYTIAPENQGVWENVQEYKFLGQDLMAMAQSQNWESYNALKAERKILGQTILSDWNSHLHYARQAGLSREAIEIACELKMRPLSLAEQEASLRIQSYATKAYEARGLWREIRHTHPGKNCYEHPHYQTFTELRITRNQLAAEILNNRPIHKGFIQQLGQDLGIGWKALQNQANQGKNFPIENYINQNKKERRVPQVHLHQPSLVQETLHKYRLEKPKQYSEADFIKKTEAFYEQMISWYQFSGKLPSIEKRKQLFERATLAVILQPEAKREYCFLSTALEAKIRSEEIALITGSLIQDRGGEKYSRKTLLKSAADFYNYQTKNMKEILMKDYQKSYPECSSYQLELLANQQLQCLHMTKIDLPEASQKILLVHARSYEELQKQGKITVEIQKIIEQPIKPFIKENDNIIDNVLERQFMGIARSEKLADIPFSKLNSEVTLQRATYCVKKIQENLDRARYQMLVIKETEKER